MSWIATIEPGEAEGALGNIYQRIAGPGGAVDNVLKIHSLRPHTLEAHLALYKNVLHHRGNSLPKWLLETIGIFVSLLNGCSYCVEHHFAGLRRLLRDDARAAAIRSALETETFAGVFDRRERALLDYAQRLTRAPAEMTDREIAALRDAGLDDGEILEVNQVASYFAYVNRTVLGLGVTTQGDTLGLSPGDAEDAGNWRHS
ncbi:MAG: peroxidase-related enzyme [Verrucomicrobiota bacterium]|nr:peroxidase-related enzyme [Verrucomicrobiota bacterium]